MTQTHGDIIQQSESVVPLDLARVPLAFLPTPLEELSRLREALGVNCPRLFIKRDDQTGLATGGNKVRKLEFSMGDALSKGADTVITTGATQSNHCRQTAASAAKLGLKSILLLRGDEPETINGNLLLDKLLDADIRWSKKKEHPAGEIDSMLEQIAAEEREKGNKPYIIPLGASNPVGALGYIAGMEEAHQQLEEMNIKIDRIVFLSGSGGTHAGMLLGAKLLNMPVVLDGILNSGFETMPTRLANLINETIKHYGFDVSVTESDIHLHQSAGTHGYGVITAIEKEALHLMAKHEGIILDPVYTGRALAGLIKNIRDGRYAKDETILFWHTGGTSGLFARADDVLSP